MLRRQIVAAPAPVPPAPPPLRYGRRLVRAAFRLTFWAALATVVLVVAAVAGAFVWSLPAPSPEARSAGTNALEMSPTWVIDPHTDEEHEQLAARLRDHQISDVLVPVGPLDADGAAPPDLVPRAAAFVQAVHRLVPDARVQASLGQLLPAAGGPLRLYDRAVRDQIVATAATYLDLGFDGIHYDFEPIRPGDRDLLDLLERTRAETGDRGGVLSVAVEQVQAHPAVASLVMPVVRTYAEPDPVYLSAVADRVDQIVIRTYGSGMPTSSAFAAYVAWQTARTARLVSNRVTIFMGVPTADTDDRWDHRPWAENPAAALHGLRRGLDALGAEPALPVGAAVHAEATASEADWQVFREEWIDPS